jgi:dipeptidyl aminopeptidase/acylaminoacyl peptidase
MTFDTRARRAVQGIHRAVEVMETSSTKTPQRVTRFDQYRERKARNKRIGAFALVAAIVAALLGIGFGAIGDRTKRPTNPPNESYPGTFTGMVIRYTGEYNNEVPGDLVARDPSSAEAITLVDDAIVPDFHGRLIAWAAASADGRWVAFESPFCQDNLPEGITEGKSGLWVTNGTDEPRQLTAPCVEHPQGPPSEGLWAWSPTGSRLGVVEGDHLILIDPATGDRTDLGQAAGDVTSLAWSPDGTQIAYATVPTGSPDGNSPDGAVYVVGVSGGEHALIAESLGTVPGGEEGAGIAWSPDGTRIAVVGDVGDVGTPTLYVMNADGSHRQLLAEGVLVAHILGSPNIVWSPDGTRIAYATFSGDHDKVQIWNGSPDGSPPVLVFDPTSSPGKDTAAGGPIWSPNGEGIAFRYDIQSSRRSYLIANADGTGHIHEIDELQYQRWRGGWYFCECYG